MDIIAFVFHVTLQDHVTKVLNDFIVRTRQGISTSYQARWPKALRQWRYFFSLLHDLARSRNQKLKRLYEWELTRVSYHPAKFGDYRQSGSGDIMILACHVTMQDQVIRGLYDLMVRSPSRYVIILPSWVAIGIVMVEISF